jgi:hypothetical protein
MRKIFIIPLFFLFFFAGFGQQVIENPEKPLSKNAGRVIRLKEVMRIVDEEGKFYFREPWAIKVAHDGSIYVQEPDKLYQFDGRGKFIRNLCKRGEGPGEFNQGLTDFFLGENEIILASSNVMKIVRFGANGALLEDLRPKGKTFFGLLSFYNGCYYLVTRERGKYERITGFYEDDLRLILVDSQGKVTSTSPIFPFTISISIGPGGRTGSTYISRLFTACENPRYVYLYSTPKYLVQLLDLEKKEVIRSFRREYERVKLATKRDVPIFMPRFHNDICRLLVHRENLWVVTSTFDKKKGILVDVFNKDGKYLDAFYLPLTKILTEERITYYAPMAVSGDFLFTIEVGDDGQISAAKYQIIDS